uniref:Sushi repeat-containing protein SRPX2 n=1 Tax=Esox lucius TaxID=8010 RepID=A0A6Q2XE27_ESOLU
MTGCAHLDSDLLPLRYTSNHTCYQFKQSKTTRRKGFGTRVESNTEFVPEEEQDYTPQLDYRNPRWCRFLNLANGEVTCHSPLGGNFHSTLGTRCEMTCDRGYKLLGRRSVQCMPSRRWSGTGHCRQVRCRVLQLIWHGTYHCTQGYTVDSRCDYVCEPGYRMEGYQSRTCLEGGSWSGAYPICADHEPPKIKCPLSRVKVADPGKLTARVSWDPPVATDSADKTVEVTLIGQGPDTDFEEGMNVIRYTAHDQARNRAACKFIVRVEVRRCPALQPPLHGHITCDADRDNYGAVCEYHCDRGYERTGTSTRVCQSDRSWTDAPAECVPADFKTDMNTASALLEQFYGKRRVLIVSTPDIADQDYKLQNLMVQKADCGLDLRQVTVLELLGSPPHEVGRIKGRHLDTEVIEGLRHAFRISRSSFSMLLLDKDGLDHERFIVPTASDEIFSYIDNNLLDEEERRRLDLHVNYCD